MADIVFRYVEMRQAVEQIREISSRYQAAANSLEEDFKSATSGWEGDSKDAMDKFIAGPVMEYTRNSVPQLLTTLAELLSANADQMQSADKQIADNIPTSLG